MRLSSLAPLYTSSWRSTEVPVRHKCVLFSLRVQDETVYDFPHLWPVVSYIQWARILFCTRPRNDLTDSCLDQLAQNKDWIMSVLISAGLRYFSDLINAQAGSGPHSASWVLSLGVERMGREINHSPPSRLRLRMSGATPLLPLYAFMALTSKTYIWPRFMKGNKEFSRSHPWPLSWYEVRSIVRKHEEHQQVQYVMLKDGKVYCIFRTTGHVILSTGDGIHGYFVAKFAWQNIEGHLHRPTYS